MELWVRTAPGDILSQLSNFVTVKFVEVNRMIEGERWSLLRLAWFNMQWRRQRGSIRGYSVLPKQRIQKVMS